MGIIPRGTANAFASALGIPSHLTSLDYIREACEVILRGNQRVVDAAWATGEWGKWPLTLLLGIGLEAETVDMADRDMKNKLGVLAYMFAGMQAITREGAMFELRVELGDSRFETTKSYAVTVANIAPATSVLSQGLGQVIPDDGLLEIMAFVGNEKERAMAGIFDLAVKQILFKSAVGEENLESVMGVRSDKIKVTADPPQKVVVDGEILGNTPVEVEVVPGGLVVLAPLPNEEEEKLRALQALRAELERLEQFIEQNGSRGILEKRAAAIREQLEEYPDLMEKSVEKSWG
uniref:DAGKc domain-containing protein n=1 Tax=Tetraselmis chuii TaxID=63592 RepID=A0A7S1T1C7_9CHLO